LGSSRPSLEHGSPVSIKKGDIVCHLQILKSVLSQVSMN